MEAWENGRVYGTSDERTAAEHGVLLLLSWTIGGCVGQRWKGEEVVCVYYQAMD